MGSTFSDDDAPSKAPRKSTLKIQQELSSSIRQSIESGNYKAVVSYSKQKVKATYSILSLEKSDKIFEDYFELGKNYNALSNGHEALLFLWLAYDHFAAKNSQMVGYATKVRDCFTELSVAYGLIGKEKKATFLHNLVQASQHKAIDEDDIQVRSRLQKVFAYGMEKSDVPFELLNTLSGELAEKGRGDEAILAAKLAFIHFCSKNMEWDGNSKILAQQFKAMAEAYKVQNKTLKSTIFNAFYETTMEEQKQREESEKNLGDSVAKFSENGLAIYDAFMLDGVENSRKGLHTASLIMLQICFRFQIHKNGTHVGHSDKILEALRELGKAYYRKGYKKLKAYFYLQRANEIDRLAAQSEEGKILKAFEKKVKDAEEDSSVLVEKKVIKQSEKQSDQEKELILKVSNNQPILPSIMGASMRESSLRQSQSGGNLSKGSSGMHFVKEETD